jgi:hypothetical protein
MATVTGTSGSTFDDIMIWFGSSLYNQNPLIFGYYSGFIASNIYTRFTNITIPQAATINSAYVQFRAYGTDSTSCILTVTGHAADNSGTFTGAGDAESRPSTSASVNWNVASWTSGNDYQSDSLTSIVQEIINRAGWSSGNAISIFFKNNGSAGQRSANSYEAGSNIPFLYIDYSTGGGGGGTIIRPIFKSFIN